MQFQEGSKGGEPFLRADLIQLLARAKAGNMVTHVTTGRYLDTRTLKEIGKYITSLQVGIKQDALIRHPGAEREKLSELIAKTRDQGIDVGARLARERGCRYDTVFSTGLRTMSRLSAMPAAGNPVFFATRIAYCEEFLRRFESTSDPLVLQNIKPLRS